MCQSIELQGWVPFLQVVWLTSFKRTDKFKTALSCCHETWKWFSQGECESSEHYPVIWASAPVLSVAKCIKADGTSKCFWTQAESIEPYLMEQTWFMKRPKLKLYKYIIGRALQLKAVAMVPPNGSIWQYKPVFGQKFQMKKPPTTCNFTNADLDILKKISVKIDLQQCNYPDKSGLKIPGLNSR